MPLTQEEAAAKYRALQTFKRAWYQKNKKRIIQAQRERYWSDPAYRMRKSKKPETAEETAAKKAAAAERAAARAAAKKAAAEAAAGTTSSSSAVETK